MKKGRKVGSVIGRRAGRYSMIRAFHRADLFFVFKLIMVDGPLESESITASFLATTELSKPDP